jgi:hypothetical protein
MLGAAMSQAQPTPSESHATLRSLWLGSSQAQQPAVRTCSLSIGLRAVFSIHPGVSFDTATYILSSGEPFSPLRGAVITLAKDPDPEILVFSAHTVERYHE